MEELERLSGIVERITYHNPENGWTVLKVSPFRDPGRLIPVVIHQAKVFAGATMEFWGSYSQHSQHGEQFKAVRALEKKPATAAALEKYIGSGLIRGVGPAIARRIVQHFNDQTLDVFEYRMEDLLGVPGIAHKKLESIQHSWKSHKAIRDVMMFLQGYGISTLFATKIYKTYGDSAIEKVSENPYCLARDIYGIGFFSADQIALAMGFERTGIPRIEAGIKHVLSSSREEGHCYLTENQIINQVPEVLREQIVGTDIAKVLERLLTTNQILSRTLLREEQPTKCYYSKSIYYDEQVTADRVTALAQTSRELDVPRAKDWMVRYCEKHDISLSDEQAAAVLGAAGLSFSLLTGGPGCGKTTTTRVLVNLLVAMRKTVLLAAPTGRAAQRMTEVIGREAKTLHRLLEWEPTRGGFKRNENEPLQCDFLIVDETSMLDIHLAASLLRAVSAEAQVLFIGDPDQLPAVGAGDVLADLLKVSTVPQFRLTKVFRQAEASMIIRYAHEINTGIVPKIRSPLADPSAFSQGMDCLFVDADEATQEQVRFVQRVKTAVAGAGAKCSMNADVLKEEGAAEPDRLYRPEHFGEAEVKAPIFHIPEKFRHVDLSQLASAQGRTEELFQVLKRVHPWSSLHYGMTALETVVRLYTKTIPNWLGPACEIQVLTPQVRGSLGTISLNEQLQRAANPEHASKRELRFGEKILRVGDRVIQTRNNYTLGVFNGDIGRIAAVDPTEMQCEVVFSGGQERSIVYEKEDLGELMLAYAVTVHKSQGSEFQCVIIPVLGQHFNMLFRNLIYTGLTRAKKLAVFVGSRQAFSRAVHQVDNRKRQTALAQLVK